MYRMFVLYLCSLTLRALILAVLARLIVLGTRRIEYRHAVWTIFLFAILTMPVADALLPRALVPASVPEVMLPIQTFLVFTPQTNNLSIASDATGIARKPGVDG